MSKIYVFVPTYHRFEKTKRSLLSLKETIQKTPQHDITLFVGDNNSPKEMKAWLTKTFHGMNCRLYLSDKNVGKPTIINFMWKECDKDCDIVCSFDSDLVAAPAHMDWIDKCARLLENDKSIGLVSTEQLEQCCHLKRLLPTITESSGSKIQYGKFFGVAGGCVFLRKNEWEKIGGYRVNALYGGDDAYLMQATAKILKKKVVVNLSAPLVHPHGDEKGYNEWKARACGKLRGEVKGPPITKGYWDE